LSSKKTVGARQKKRSPSNQNRLWDEGKMGCSRWCQRPELPKVDPRNRPMPLTEQFTRSVQVNKNAWGKRHSQDKEQKEVRLPETRTVRCKHGLNPGVKNTQHFGGCRLTQQPPPVERSSTSGDKKDAFNGRAGKGHKAKPFYIWPDAARKKKATIGNANWGGGGKIEPQRRLSNLGTCVCKTTPQLRV